MSDFMENNGQLMIMGALLLGSMLALMTCSALLPKPYDMIVGGTLYFSIIIGGFGGGMLYTRERYNKYPHYRLIIFPTKEEISIFVQYQRNIVKDGGKNNTAKITCAFSRTFSGIGSTKRVNINFGGDWAKRTHMSPADITVNGFSVPHPASETLVVKYCDNSHIAIEEQELVPVFELVCGSTDLSPVYDIVNIDIPDYLNTGKTAITTMQKNETVATLAGKLVQAYGAITSLRGQLLEQARRATEWQSIAQTFKDTIQQQKAEIRGLLASHSETKERALEFLLPIYNGQGSLAKTIKAIRAKNDNNKWMLYVALIAIVGIIALFLYTQPKLMNSVGDAINSPWMILAIGIICAAAVIFALKFYKPNNDNKRSGGRKK